MSEPTQSLSEEQLFDTALALPPERRAAYVQSRAGGDRALIGRVLDLLAAHATAGIFLETPAVRARASAAEAEIPDGPGTVIGPYELIDELGEGGFGIVYRARQSAPVKREVALKIIKLGMDTRQVIARFGAERQALAVMDHPNIASVLDAGATSTGRPYFVMELVEGEEITRYCDRHQLTTTERIRLFQDICEALHHAHQRGLIHRDIKPSNILVASRDGRHAAKVIDFGIAKATKQRLGEETVHTEAGQFIGTPVYMSPEQAEHGESDIDTRSDIYSLGVVLYELLTGSPPFEAADLRGRALAEIQTFIREHQPVAPSGRVTRLGDRESTVAAARQVEIGHLSSQLRGDLDWIVMKSLEKERERRYDSAQALSEDLGRFLDHLPVLASPPSRLYRVRKFVRRHRIAVAAGAGVVAALLIGVALMMVGFLRANEQARIAGEQRDILTEVIQANSSSRATRESLRGAEELDAALIEAFGIGSPLLIGARRLSAERMDSEGRFEEATALYRTVLADIVAQFGPDSPERVSVLLQLGRMHVRSGDTQDAKQEFERALNLEQAAFEGPSYQLNGARLGLAEILAGDDQNESSLALLAEANRLAREQTPEDFNGRVRVCNAYTSGAIRAREHLLALPAFDELIDLTDQMYPGPTLRRAEVRYSFAAWARGTEEIAAFHGEQRMREALAIYEQIGDTTSIDVVRVQSLLATSLLSHQDPESIQEGFALSDRAIDNVRVIYGDPSPELLSALSSHATGLDRHGLRARALTALLEVIELRRALHGADAEVSTQKDALERITDAIVKDPSLPLGHMDLRVARDAARLLDRENQNRGYQGYSQLYALARLRTGDATFAFERIGGLMGYERPKNKTLHPYDLAVGALAQHTSGSPVKAEELLTEASALAASPQYASDRRTQEMVRFAVGMVRGVKGPTAQSAAEVQAQSPGGAGSAPAEIRPEVQPGPGIAADPTQLLRSLFGFGAGG